MEHFIDVDPEGNARAIYSDDLVSLFSPENGKVTITRASHVEPDPRGGWLADLTPSGGPVLGPFALREEALTAERVWIEDHLFGA